MSLLADSEGPEQTVGMHRLVWPRGYKTFFMLNSAEHEIFSANKYENANNCWHFHISYMPLTVDRNLGDFANF